MQFCIFACTLSFAATFEEQGYCAHRGIRSSHNPPYSTYERLRKDIKAPREEWLKLVSAFLTIQAKGPKEEAPRALLFAGRAALILYGRSGKREDLDKAINCLNTLVRKYEKSSHFIDGLKELKRADQLKLSSSLAAVQTSSLAISRPSGKESAQGDGGAAASEADGIDRGARSLNPVRPQSQTTAPLQGRNMSHGLWASRAGNPYFGAAVSGSKPDNAPIDKAVPQQQAVRAIDKTRRVSEEIKSGRYVIVLDPGHGGKDPGAVSPDGSMKEKDFTLELCYRIRTRLQGLLPGTEVKLTRNDDTYLALVERAELANSANADLFLSIHGNGYEDTRAQGVETFYLSAANTRGAMRVAARENGISLSRMTDLQATLVDLTVTGKKTESALLARQVHKSLVATLRERGHATRDRGVKTAPFYVLLGAKMPAILLECVFLTSTNDRENLLNMNKLDYIAEGIATGTVNYLQQMGEKGSIPALTTCLGR